jgi:hypothetical protein
MDRSPFYAHPDAAARLPPALRPMAEALDLVPACPHWPDGWVPYGYPDAPRQPLVPDAPPFDDVYRGSWRSPGVCLRLALSHPSVPAEVADRLRADHPTQIGADGALYLYGIDRRSQRLNVEAVVERLAATLAGQP